MSVAAVGSVGAVGGAGAVDALSPYLNGVVRASDVVVAPQAATSAAPAPATPAQPYANPAIADIGQQAAIAATLGGDAGLVVQSYGAVALATSPLALAPVFTQPVVPLTPPVAPIPAIAPIDLVA